MKKVIATTLITTAIAAGAFAQGSIASINNTGIYFGLGAGSQDPTSSSVYTGALTLEVFFSSQANAAEITSINGLNGTAGGGAAALAILQGASDGFQLVGTATGAADAGSQISGFPGTIDLANVASGGFASSTAGVFAFYFAGTGAYSTYSGALVFSGGNYGGDPGNATQQPYAVNGNAALASLAGAQNLALTAPAVPEPATMALAALGGASLLMFRRKK